MDLITKEYFMGGVWSPLNLAPHLLGWFKADAGVFTDLGITPATNGQTAEQWNDQSGNANHLTSSTAINRPTYNTGVLNGLPGLSFVNSNNQFMVSPTFSLGGKTASVFALVRGNTSPANGRISAFIANGHVNDFDNAGSTIFLVYTSTTTVQSSSNSVNLSSGTVTDATFFELGSICDGVNNTLYINNVAQTPVADTNTFGATGTFTASGNGGNTPSNMTLCELILTNNALPAIDRTNLHKYLLNKWGI